MHVLPALFLLIIGIDICLKIIVYQWISKKRFGVGWVILVYSIYIAFNKGDFVHVHVQG